MRHLSLVGIVPLLLLFAGGEAAAHAFLDHAEPRVGNKVASAPREVTPVVHSKAGARLQRRDGD